MCSQVHHTIGLSMVLGKLVSVVSQCPKLVSYLFGFTQIFV